MFNFTAEFTNIDCFIKTINRINHRLILYAINSCCLFIHIKVKILSIDLDLNDEIEIKDRKFKGSSP